MYATFVIAECKKENCIHCCQYSSIPISILDDFHFLFNNMKNKTISSFMEITLSTLNFYESPLIVFWCPFNIISLSDKSKDTIFVKQCTKVLHLLVLRSIKYTDAVILLTSTRGEVWSFERRCPLYKVQVSFSCMLMVKENNISRKDNDNNGSAHRQRTSSLMESFQN
ncbi:hypothetical protein K501DRAFT_272139 [Backusella circina FSU 941]|nr:hypothetical protein K501DRAFT_272139 [Backusella circina FSU 941]